MSVKWGDTEKHDCHENTSRSIDCKIQYFDMDKRLLYKDNHFLASLRAVFVLALGLFMVTAHAPQVYGQSTVSGGSFESDETLTPFFLDPAGSLNYFNGSLGNLTGVEITFQGFGVTEITITNAHETEDLRVTQLATSLDLLFAFDDSGIQAVLDGGDGGFNMIANLTIPGVSSRNPIIVEPVDDYNSGEVNAEDEVTLLITDSNQLAAFIGSGAFDVSCDALAEVSATFSGGNFGAGQVTSGGCGIEITYTYEPNPIVLTEGPCWRTLSSPVEQTWAQFFASFETNGINHGGLWTQGVPGARDESGASNVYTMNENGTGWVPISNLNAIIPAGTGVVVSVFADDDPQGWPIVDNSGSPSFGFPKIAQFSGATLGRSADVTLGSEEGTTDSAGGFSILGNPYETGINFNEVLDGASGIEEAAWVYDRNSGGNWISTNGDVGVLAQGLIAAGQGFVVQNLSGPDSGIPRVIIGEEAKVYEGVDFVGKETAKPDHFRMEVRNEDVYNSAWVQLSHNGSLTENIGGDVTQFYPYETEYAVLSTIKQGSMLDIGHFPYPDEEISIPLTIETTSNAPMTLTLTDLNIGVSSPLYLHDTVTGESIELTEGAEYTFSSDGSNLLAKAVDGCFTAPGPLTGPGGTNKAVSPRFLINTNAFYNDGGSVLPTTFSLEQNYPNPFNPTTQITYQLPEQSQVTLSVYDMTGRQVATLINENVSAGTHTVNFDASNLSSGVYMYRLNTGTTMLTRKLTLIK